jgi:hypothetical protein
MFIPQMILTSNEFNLASKTENVQLNGGWANFKTYGLLKNNKVKFDLFIKAEDAKKYLESTHAKPANTKLLQANQDSTLTLNKPLNGESSMAFKFGLEDENNIEIDLQTYTAFSLTLHLAQISGIRYKPKIKANTVDNSTLKIRYERLGRKFELKFFIPLLNSDAVYFEKFINNIQLQIHCKRKYLELHSDMSMLLELNRYHTTKKLHRILNDDEMVKDAVKSVKAKKKAQTCEEKKLLSFLNKCNRNVKTREGALLGLTNIKDFKYKLISQTSNKGVVKQMLLNYEEEIFPEIIFNYLFDQIKNNKEDKGNYYGENYESMEDSENGENYESMEDSESGENCENMEDLESEEHSEIDWENQDTVDEDALNKVYKLNMFVISYQTCELFLNEEKLIMETDTFLQRWKKTNKTFHIGTSRLKKTLGLFLSNKKKWIKTVKQQCSKLKASQIVELKNLKIVVKESDQHLLNNIQKMMNKKLNKDIYKPTMYKAWIDIQ